MDVAAMKNEVATLSCETAKVEFKSGTGTTDGRFWVQVIRSVLAMHNSGGGVIIFGLDSSGRASQGDLLGLRSIDPIEISEKAKHYTGRPLSDVVREEFERNNQTLPGWIIPSAVSPVPFSRAGDVQNGKGKPEKLFHPGQVYVRRGASSVPADAADIAILFERARTAAQRELLSQIGQLAPIPPGGTLQVLPPGAFIATAGHAGSVRITDDPAAPGAVIVDKFKTHKYPRKEAITRLAARLPETRLTVFDIQCIRAIHGDEIRQLDLIYEPNVAPPRYSDSFLDWTVRKAAEDPAFFTKTRAAYDSQRRHRRRLHHSGNPATP